MSFEGYYQVLCENGHYETFNVYLNDVQYWECSECGGPCVWYNLVDYTNGSYDEEGNRVDGFVQLEVLKEFTCICDKCGLPHKMRATTYFLPPKGVGHEYGNTKR